MTRVPCQSCKRLGYQCMLCDDSGMMPDPSCAGDCCNADGMSPEDQSDPGHYERDRADTIRKASECGWALMHTGGGCEALARRLPDGRLLLVTEQSDAIIPSMDAPCQIGLYDGDPCDGIGDQIWTRDYESTAAGLLAIDALIKAGAL